MSSAHYPRISPTYNTPQSIFIKNNSLFSLTAYLINTMIIISTQKIHRLENKETVTTPTETADDDDTFSHINYPFVMHTYTYK